MKFYILLFALVCCGCSGSDAKTDAVPIEKAESHPVTIQPWQPASIGEARSVAIPVPASEEGREVHVIIDEPALKLVSITLRNGTELPEHATPVAALIQTISGTGVMLAGGTPIDLDPAHVAVLEPGQKHSIKPNPEEPLVLLVHHLGRAEKKGEEAHGEGHHGDHH